MIKKCYVCGNIYLFIEHGYISGAFYPNTHTCPVCKHENLTQLNADDLEGFIDYYKTDGSKLGYDIKKLEHILEIARMSEMLDKMRNEND